MARYFIIYRPPAKRDYPHSRLDVVAVSDISQKIALRLHFFFTNRSGQRRPRISREYLWMIKSVKYSRFSLFKWN